MEAIFSLSYSRKQEDTIMFQLTEDQLTIQDVVRTYAQGPIKALADEIDKTGRFPSRREPPSAPAAVPPSRECPPIDPTEPAVPSPAPEPSAAGTGSLPLQECAKARSGCGSPETKGISPLNRKKSGCHPGGTGAEIGLAERTPVYPLFSKAEKPPLTHVRGGRTSTVPP